MHSLRLIGLLVLLALAGCVSQPLNMRLAGVYRERIASKEGSYWSLVLTEWGDFTAEHSFARAKPGVDGEIQTIQTGDEGYRGKWALHGQSVTLKRDDGQVESLAIRESFWSLQLVPARRDQSTLVWEEKLLIR